MKGQKWSGAECGARGRQKFIRNLCEMSGKIVSSMPGIPRGADGGSSGQHSSLIRSIDTLSPPSLSLALFQRSEGRERRPLERRGLKTFVTYFEVELGTEKRAGENQIKFRTAETMNERKSF